MRRCSPARAAVSTRIAISLALGLSSARAFAQEAAETVAPAGSPASPEPAPVPAPEPSPRQAPPADADANALLVFAEAAMAEVDYARTRELARAAVVRGKLDSAGLARAYRLIAVSSAQLGDDPEAERAFIRLFALEPDSTIATRLAPARRSAVLNARGFWSARRDAFGLEVSYARLERRVLVRVRDPLAWGRDVHLAYRISNRRFSESVRPAAAELTFDVGGAEVTAPIELYAFLTDAYGNVIAEFGDARAPRSFRLTDREFDELSRRDIRGGQPGSYALRLEELGVEVGVHGYLSLEFKPVEEQASFDLHHATAMIRASFRNALSLELALEWEHLARQLGDFYLPHAFLDLKLADALVVRGGLFEVPIGAFNEYLYPDFLRITGLPPHFSRAIVPALWSEVGLSLRGRFALGETSNLTYAVFVVNGLEQADAEPDDGVVEEGGDIRAMRWNARDRHSGDKAFGGRLGLEAGDFDLGVSGYSGRYTVEGNRRLSIGDVDASYRGEFLTVRTEAALAFQEVSGDVMRKFGLYTLIAVRPIPHLEPYAQYDYLETDAPLHRALLGFAFYPFPEDRATRQLRLKSEAGFDFPEGGERVFVWFFQLTTGF